MDALSSLIVLINCTISRERSQRFLAYSAVHRLPCRSRASFFAVPPSLHLSFNPRLPSSSFHINIECVLTLENEESMTCTSHSPR